ncbi:hypothetical protein [Saccharibacillus kuerlensis]|uniref:DUF559 domain-containing protein n=1 Tax=Saccharibacillus kuerlensis TaxID=459527 RepID=A0ABQ2L6W5_9BACL|nr:hypothetical protein [Saccharibacillus kuerlensis]GGO05361.1 hypothetical protein GCM10010969_31690 [Saccharibacillus kuerlensis]
MDKKGTTTAAEPLSEFETAHAIFLEQHLSRRSGERRGRLERGHQYAEKLFLQNVWWPLFGSLKHLHPEYEIYDWNRRSQFLDFAFLPESGGRIGIECDGFQSHIKDMDREKFSYALNRDSFLTGLGWKMLHFAFDDIQRRPEVCRMLLQMSAMPMIVGTSASKSPGVRGNEVLTPMQKDVLRFAWRLGRAIRPKDVIETYRINFRTARSLLNSLVEQSLMKPVGSGKYVRYYEVVGGFPKFLIE